MLVYRPAESAPATMPDPSSAFAPTPPQEALPAPTAPAPAPPPPPAPAGIGKGTMLGIAMPDAAFAAARAQAAAAPAVAPPATSAHLPVPPMPPAPPSGGELRAGAKTMLGVAVSPLAATMASAPSPAAPYPAAPPAPQAPGAEPARVSPQRTMLGVAIPGIAPRASEVPATVNTGIPQASPPAASPAVPARGGATMLGVAIPGIAPVAPGQAYAPPGGPPPVAPAPGAPRASVNPRLKNTAIGAPIVPAPAPFVDDEPVPQAPAKRARGGVPVGLVAGIVGGLLLAGGALIAFFYRSAPPIEAQPRLDAQGNEVLHLQCANCPDGTVATLDGAKSSFKASEADLPLAKPLDVGENTLVVHVERPGVGRDESVKLVVPIAFHIRADLGAIDAKPPVITVRVAAAPGTDVSVDGKPLALDGSGHGAYALDVSTETEGATEEPRVIDRKIPYAVTAKGGKPETGVVTARIGVVPLRIDEPSAHAVIDGAEVVVAGQTAPGGAVTLGDAPVTVGADGAFVEKRPAPPLGASLALEIRATAAGRAPRTAHVTVKHASLDAEAKALDAAGGLLTYDQVAADIASKVGQRAVVSGEVLESRVTGHQTIALVNDTRGCKSGPCLARIIAAEDAKMARGSLVRAYGTITRGVGTNTGKTIPELEADFVARGR